MSQQNYTWYKKKNPTKTKQHNRKTIPDAKEPSAQIYITVWETSKPWYLMEWMFCHNCFCLYIPDFHSPVVRAGGTEVVLTRVMRKCEARDPFGVSHQLPYDFKQNQT